MTNRVGMAALGWVAGWAVTLILPLCAPAWLAAEPVSLIALDAPSPTEAPTPTTSPSPTPTLPCDEVLRFAAFDGSGPLAFAPDQSVVIGTSFTNPTGYTYPNVVMEVQLVGALDRMVAHLPRLEWSLDGRAWQPISHWNDVTGNGSPNFYSDKLPLGTVVPGSTHTIRFSASFAAGAASRSYDLFAYVELPQCFGGDIGASNPLLFGYDPSTEAPVGAIRPTSAVQTARPTPSPTRSRPPATATPIPAIGASPVADARPGPPSRPLEPFGIAAAVVFAGLTVHMGRRWWSARRRLP